MTLPTVIIQVNPDGEILNPEVLDEARAALAAESGPVSQRLEGSPHPALSRCDREPAVRDTDERYPVPEADDFRDPATDHERDFLPARDLERLAAALLSQHGDLFHSHDDFRIHYLWKRAGKMHQGAAVFGTCVRASGLAKYFGETDYVVWLAADHVRAARFTCDQVEALLFHELMHIEIDAETGKAGTRAHDFEGFIEELARYGFWRGSLRRVGEVAQQRSRFGDGGAA